MIVTPPDATKTEILQQDHAQLFTCACTAILSILRLVVIMLLYPAGTVSTLHQNTQGLLMPGFKQTWEKVRCSWKAAERLPSLVSWLRVVGGFGFKDISLWHYSEKFSWSSLAEKCHSSSGDGNTVEGALLGRLIYISILKNTIHSCLCPPTHLQEGAGLWSSCDEVFRPLVACKAGHCTSSVEQSWVPVPRTGC